MSDKLKTSDTSEKDDSNKSSEQTSKWINSTGGIVTKIITPTVTIIIGIFTGFNTFQIDRLDRERDLSRYFQQEIRDSVEKLAGEDSDVSRVTFASLYSLADNYDKKRILISMALSRDSDDLDEAIAYLILSEDEKTRKEMLVNNLSLREAARRIETEWASQSYKALESVKTNADVRPQITNASTQLLSLFSSDSLSGWIFLGRLKQPISKELDKNTNKEVEAEKEIILDFEEGEFEGVEGKAIVPEGAITNSYSVKDLIDSTVDIESPIYVRQSPPSNNYVLKDIIEDSNTSIIGVLCKDSKVEVKDYKPVKANEGNYTLWGKVIVKDSKACYEPKIADDPSN